MHGNLWVCIECTDGKDGMNMCAIAGVISLNIDDGTCKDILRSMRRRGPDGSGIFRAEECALLHSRLAIIDPAGGKQPMTCIWEGAQYTIVYNGELYNTQEIRRSLQSRGHTFTTNSDTEVVLHAFAEWKEQALQLLNGIFALAVWNDAEKSLFLARDRMGVKPLFYTQHKGGLIFASEIKTVLSYPGINATLNAEGAAQILLFGPGRIPGSGVFRDMYELEPACFGWYREGKLSVQRYWQLRDRIHTETFRETAEQVRYLVKDAIHRQMVSDVPIGTFLSGGLDSSLITAVCAGKLKETGEMLKTFSLDYRDNDKYFKPGKFQPNSDADYIGIMEHYLQVDGVHTVLTPEELVGHIAHATHARDLPGMADVDTSLLVFCSHIKKHVKVALSGECADEIFGGYPWYRDPAVRSADGFPWAQNTSVRASLLAPWISTSVDSEEFVQSAYRSTIGMSDILPENSPLERRMKEMVNLNYYWFMQTLLDRKDRMSMYNGLEVRVPFCDYRIAEYLYGVPWEYKDYNGQEKGLLRYAMRGILPDEILYRKKSPYPKTHDPMYLQLVQKELESILSDPGEPIHQLVQKEALLAYLDSGSPWPWYGQLMQVPQTITYMIQVNTWLKEYHVQIA